jgi:pyrroline-5-carboxylate reductase
VTARPTGEPGPRWPLSIGVVGAGAMGSALAEGIARTRDAGDPIVLHDAAAGLAERVAAGLEGVRAGSAAEAASADLVCVAVKPVDTGAALDGLELREGAVLLSVVAGWDLDRLAAARPGTALARTMPNLAVRHGRGVIAVATRDLGREHEADLMALLSGLGAAVALPERLFPAATALAGSGPGFVALIAEALEEGGVAAGLSRAQARAIVPAVLDGTAALLTDGQDPATLRQRVSSPSGTTVAGIAVLERGAVRAHVADAVKAAAARAAEL